MRAGLDNSREDTDMSDNDTKAREARMSKQASERADSATTWLVQVIATDLESMEATQRLVGGEEVGRSEDLVLFTAADGPIDAEGKTPAEIYAITVRKLDEDEVTDILDHRADAAATEALAEAG